MPNLSLRGEKMPASPIRKLVPYADVAKSKGISIFHLNIGQPDIETPDVALKAVKNIDMQVLDYSHSAGLESYRKGLAEYYNQFTSGITASNIIVTTGGSEALLFGFSTCLNPGDEVIIPEPFYANYNGFAELAGVKIVPINSSIENGFALPPIDEFISKISPKTKAILICNPGNPTGYLYSKEELEQLRDIVKKHDLFLFADEVYREFCYDGNEHFSVLNLEGIDDHVVLVDSVSKRYSMCGVRIGALVSKNTQLMETAMKFAQARLSPPLLGQIASEAALKTPGAYFEKVKKEYTERRDILVDGLNSIEGVFCPKPGGAFYVVAKLPVEDSDHFCRWMLEDFSHEGATVMMAPASGFYSKEGLGKNEVRMAYVLQKEKLEKAVECLREALKVYQG